MWKHNACKNIQVQPSKAVSATSSCVSSPAVPTIKPKVAKAQVAKAQVVESKPVEEKPTWNGTVAFDDRQATRDVYHAARDQRLQVRQQRVRSLISQAI